MSKIEELKEEELEKVTGGAGESIPTRNVLVYYKDTVDGMDLWTDLGRYPTADAEANGEAMAKEWCATNNKIYYGWEVANLLTNNYDAQKLLVTFPEMTIKME